MSSVKRDNFSTLFLLKIFHSQMFREDRDPDLSKIQSQNQAAQERNTAKQVLHQVLVAKMLQRNCQVWLQRQGKLSKMCWEFLEVSCVDVVLW